MHRLRSCPCPPNLCVGGRGGANFIARPAQLQASSLQQLQISAKLDQVETETETVALSGSILPMAGVNINTAGARHAHLEYTDL